jgi:ATP-dependent Clp protease, protease subunit
MEVTKFPKETRVRPNPLLQLLIDNKELRPVKGKQTIFGEADGEKTLYLYDFVVSTNAEAGFWGGVSAEDLVPQIRALGTDTLAIRINSPGGDVFGGQAIAQALRDHKGKVVAYIDGDAASIASVIAVAADEVVMAQGAMIMIHNSSTLMWGNRNDMLETAALLEKIDGVIAQGYAQKTKKDAAEYAPLMDAETWYTAEEAVAAGLADRISVRVKAQIEWDLSAYKNAKKHVPLPPVESDSPTITDDHRARQKQRIELLALVP